MNPQGPNMRPMQPWPGQPEPRRRFSWLALAALVVAVGALVTAIIGLTRSEASGGRAPSGSVAASSSTARPSNTTDANRAFCTDIAPLMAESDKTAQTYSHLGTPNSPEWKSGAQTFVNDTKAWLPRMQTVIDTHGDAAPFLLRSTQRFADDLQFLIEDLESGPWERYDQTIWDDSTAAVSGPLNVCAGVGVKW